MTDRPCRAASYSGHAYSRFDERDGYVKIVLDPARTFARTTARCLRDRFRRKIRPAPKPF